MLTLYRTENCPACSGIEEALDNMTMPHRVLIVHGKGEIAREAGVDAEPPLLVDEHESFQGIGPILEHLEELASFKKQWEKYQSDVCYCADDDETE